MGVSFEYCFRCKETVNENYIRWCEDCENWLCDDCLETTDGYQEDNEEHITNCYCCKIKAELSEARLEFCKKYNIPIEEVREIL